MFTLTISSAGIVRPVGTGFNRCVGQPSDEDCWLVVYVDDDFARQPYATNGDRWFEVYPGYGPEYNKPDYIVRDEVTTRRDDWYHSLDRLNAALQAFMAGECTTQ